MGGIRLNVLSLFDGKSCGQIALERSGFNVDNYFASEVESFPMQLTQYHYPNTKQLGDVTKWREWELPEIDLLMGGSPCQGFSRQGTQLNFDHPQSKLFFEFVDVLKAVKPKYFLLENVFMKNEWRDIISDYLGVGYVELNSKLVSAQNRPRLYWTNIPFNMPEDKNIVLKDILEDVPTNGFIEYKGLKIDPTVSENSISLIDVIDGEVRISQTVKKGYIVAEDGDGINLSFPTSKSRRGRVIKQKSSTIDTACNLCVFYKGAIRRFTITEIERLQTLPDGYTGIIPLKNRMKAIGNGWTVDVIAHILKGMEL
jgi:DNA-cytosine methyltransferase